MQDSDVLKARILGSPSQDEAKVLRMTEVYSVFPMIPHGLLDRMR